MVARDYYSYPKTSGVLKQTIFGIRDATANIYSLRFHHNMDLDRLNGRTTPLSANPPMSEYMVFNVTMYDLIPVTKSKKKTQIY